MGNGDDILMWPNGTWCYSYERGDYLWLSDDYIRIKCESAEWYEIVADNEK